MCTNTASEVFGKCFSTLWSCSFAARQVPFLTLSLRPSGPVQPQPQPATGSVPAKALSHLSTEDQRAPQFLQPHSCCTCQTSLSAPLPLLSAHVFPRLTTNPPFMCIFESLEFTGLTTLGTLSHVIVSSAMLFHSWFNFLRLCLFLFVSFILTAKSCILRVGA